MKYMVEIKLPKYKNYQFQSLIPDQQRQIAEWMQEGRIDTFSLNNERTKVWFVISAENRLELDAIIEEFVTRRYMLRIKIEPLMVFESRAFQLPPLVLN